MSKHTFQNRCNNYCSRNLSDKVQINFELSKTDIFLPDSTNIRALIIKFRETWYCLKLNWVRKTLLCFKLKWFDKFACLSPAKDTVIIVPTNFKLSKTEIFWPICPKIPALLIVQEKQKFWNSKNSICQRKNSFFLISKTYRK